MEPNRSPQATLNDLLDRILDKGLLLNTDLIVTVAGIPLIGINLKLALAGMETMLEYGIMKDWDEAQRAVARKETERQTPTLGNEEEIIFSVFGSHWYSKGIYNNWRPGTIYITNERLIMFRKIPYEVLLDIKYEKIKGMAIQEKDHFINGTREELYLVLQDDEMVRLHTTDVLSLKKAMENIITTKGISLEDNLVFPVDDEVLGEFMKADEKVTHSGKMWYRYSYIMEGTTHYQWKPGQLYLTDQRLCWWCDFDKKLLFEISTDAMVHIAVQDVQFGTAPIEEKSLVLLYKDGQDNQVVCFSDNEESLREWEKVIKEQIGDSEKESEKNMETCPICGKKEKRETLLSYGCSRCGWMSHRKQS
ncbi:gas vesicle protein GvpJ [Anaerosacchariphilus polymeriproducens]|uniref:gas vesicle protein GvpJ n=1 Tax=Anaerosacchariphilus polymeriproducens TaxID=1812858 RepID=UPI0013906811|nr:gas vesicle protein GvpJ [Anaerosacchariphilus polymeriproducens]